MKAILVTNMSDDMDFETLERAEIRIWKKDVCKYIFRNARLKPMPKERNLNAPCIGTFNEGYNACLGEILGE